MFVLVCGHTTVNTYLHRGKRQGVEVHATHTFKNLGGCWHWFAASITGDSQSAQMGPLTLQVM